MFQLIKFCKNVGRSGYRRQGILSGRPYRIKISPPPAFHAHGTAAAVSSQTQHQPWQNDHVLHAYQFSFVSQFVIWI